MFCPFLATLLFAKLVRFTTPTKLLAVGVLGKVSVKFAVRTYKFAETALVFTLITDTFVK